MILNRFADCLSQGSLAQSVGSSGTFEPERCTIISLLWVTTVPWWGTQHCTCDNEWLISSSLLLRAVGKGYLSFSLCSFNFSPLFFTKSVFSFIFIQMSFSFFKSSCTFATLKPQFLHSYCVTRPFSFLWVLSLIPFIKYSPFLLTSRRATFAPLRWPGLFVVGFPTPPTLWLQNTLSCMKHVTHFRWRQLKNVIEAGRRFLFVLAKTKTNWSGRVEGLKGVCA